MLSNSISRRQMLQGLGTMVALPWLEKFSMAAGPIATSAQAPAKRLAFLYVPNGIHMADWTPAAEGKLGELPKTLQALNGFKDSINVMTGLTLDKARANGDGPGDHARAMSVFLTGRQPRKTHGADIKVGMSADQHVATLIGEETRFPSLELGIERGGQAGNCDSGYSCAYSSNLSWRSENTPNAKEVDPKAVFDRLFGGNDPKEVSQARAKRNAYNRSVLDFVMEDAKTLTGNLGQGDQRKMDEYFTSVREIEVQLQKIAEGNKNGKPIKPTIDRPNGVPRELQDHIRLMCDMMVLAFQLDLTRVATLPFANDGSNRSYPMIQVGDGHHNLSHHGGDANKQEKIQKINTFHIDQLAYLLNKLSKIKEANGTTLLDNCMMVYGSGISDGNRHNHDDLPVLLLGKGGGTYDSGRHLKYAKETPLMNLYLALFERMGAPTQAFGDSTGVLKI